MFRSYTLVMVQFALIAFLAWYGGFDSAWFPNLFLAAGLVLGLWAILAMHFRFNIIPDVRVGQTLITAGPYRFVRHPMYTAVLLVTLSFVLERPDIVSFLAWCVLLVDLLVKLRYEERLLAAQFSDYADYMTRTKRLLPGLY